MTRTLRALGQADAVAMQTVWQRASNARRSELGLPHLDEVSVAIDRPGAFGVGLYDEDQLQAIAVAMPALGDDGRSTFPVPGLAHISSVATDPDGWGLGLAGDCLRGVMRAAIRRGFARCQLWTQASNERARRLYLREGFGLSGRTKVHDNGEDLVHLVRDLAAPAPIARAASRVVCLDPLDRILLLHWRDPLDGHQLWEPPGGGVEEGETAAQAALREWAEETGLPAPELPEPPTAVARDTWWNGTRVVVDESCYLARTWDASEPRPIDQTAVEQTAYLGHAWVPWSEIAHLEDPAEPDLLPILRRLAPGGPWGLDPA